MAKILAKLSAAINGKSSVEELQIYTEECLQELESSKAKVMAIKAIFNACPVPSKRYSAVVVSTWRVLGQSGWQGDNS